jgi:hypothetical protein
MSLILAKEVAALQRLPATQLRARYAEVFGEPTRANNRTWLVKRIAWRLQALAEGDLSERARQRAAALANDANLRLTPPKAPRTPTPAPMPLTPVQTSPGDGRLPPPGTILTRPYKGVLLQVQVLANGFAFQGEVYRSLSAVAKAITGSHCNGFQFFRRALCNPRGHNAHPKGPRGELMDDRHSKGGVTV